MSFSQSSVNYRLEDSHILRATLYDSYGNIQESSIDLNLYIGNENGK